jgi:phage/plasmid-like protein (TIGR03299 family)
MANRILVKGEFKMSAETPDYLRNNILVGFTDTRGDAWWNSRGMTNWGGVDMSVDSNGESNHYGGAIPIEDVRRRIFNWSAERLPIYVPNLSGGMDDPEYVAIPDRIAIARSDTGTVMGIFKDGYVVHQYDEWLMQNIATILDDDLAIGSVGILQNGAVGWVSVEVPENIVTPEGVEFRPNLFGVTSHNGTMATMFKRCVTNIVCDNTLNCARNEAGQEIKVKHTKNSGFRIQNARDALAVIHSASDDFAAEVAELSKVKVTGPAFSRFLDLWSPVPQDSETETANKRAVTLSENRRSALTNLWKSDPRVAPWNGNVWGIVQAVNTFDQHLSSVHTGGEENVTAKQNARWQRSIFSAVNGDLDKRTNDVIGMALAAAGK